MAKKFLTPIDLNQLELQNARLQNLATAPSSPVKGQVYFNTTNNEALVWNGTAWVPWDGVKKTSTTPKMDGTAAIGSETKYAAGDHVHPTDTSRAASNHAHGNITNGGDITATAPTIASGDQIIINDHSASKITNGPTFDGSTTTKALTPKGTWETFNNYSHPTYTQKDTGLYRISITSEGHINSASSAEKYIDGVKFDGTSNIDHLYVIDLTTIENDTIVLPASVYGDLQAAGTIVYVRFSNSNSASIGTGSTGSNTCKLKTSNGNAQPIRYRNATNNTGANLTVTTAVGWFKAGSVFGFINSNNEWFIIGDRDTNTTYSSGTDAELTAGTVAANRVWSPKILHDYVAGVVGGADAMRFKGTIGTGGTVTTLPTTGVKVGDTYRIITAGTYAGQTCEIGDLIIATATTPTWTVAQTNIDGAITSISGTAPISVTGSGNSRTVAHSNSGVIAASKGDTSNQTPGWGSTFKALSGTVNATGHLTAFAEHTVKIPNSTATTSAAGLMSSSDKQNLDNLMNSYDATQISAGSTSVSVSSPVMDYIAYIVNSSSAYEEVVVDCSNSISGSTVTTTFSIAAAINKDINIMYQIGG